MITSHDQEAAVGAAVEILAAEDPWRDLPPTAKLVVESAVRSFADRGFHATTLKHIAAGSGLSTAALYVHFGSKDELLYEISRRGHESALTIVEKAAALEPADHAFHTLVYVFARWHAERHTVARVVQYQLNALTGVQAEKIADIRRRTEHVVRRVVAAVSTTGDDDIDLRGLSAAVISLGIDVARWYQPDGRYTPDEVGRLQCRLAARLLQLGSHSASSN
ncbi:TetR/AcrR family transcriptional regulator (plasmid) [Rhodococcus sp. DMU1]|nr:TetR/AcrR family transcriptional regulator [Rhodococcus sp. DMU1]